MYLKSPKMEVKTGFVGEGHIYNLVVYAACVTQSTVTHWLISPSLIEGTYFVLSGQRHTIHTQCETSISYHDQ